MAQVRSLRSARAWPYAIASGIAYVYMVAAWGGSALGRVSDTRLARRAARTPPHTAPRIPRSRYVFVFNLIGVHAGVLVLLGRFSSKLWLSYTLWCAVPPRPVDVSRPGA